jgi:hypothetical protein
MEQLTEKIMAEDLKTEMMSWKIKYEKAIHFIEMTEALTYDDATSKRIQTFLKEEGIWQ